VPHLVRYRPAKHFTGEDAFLFTVSDGEFTSEPAIVRVTVDGTLRRELDGDGGLFGCTAAPGVRGGGTSPTLSPPLSARPVSRSPSYGGTLALLLIGLGLVVMRRRRR